MGFACGPGKADDGVCSVTAAGATVGCDASEVCFESECIDARNAVYALEWVNYEPQTCPSDAIAFELGYFRSPASICPPDWGEVPGAEFFADEVFHLSVYDVSESTPQLQTRLVFPDAQGDPGLIPREVLNAGSWSGDIGGDQVSVRFRPIDAFIVVPIDSSTSGSSSVCGGPFSNSSVQIDGTCVCDPNHDWCAPADPDDFECCALDACISGSNNHVVGDDCVCNAGFQWCDASDITNLDCCEIPTGP